jgi:hypothetical protein
LADLLAGIRLPLTLLLFGEGARSFAVEQMSLLYDVRIGGKDGGARGALKLSGDGAKWQTKENDRNVSVKAADIMNARWVKIGRHFQLKFQKQDSSVVR